MTTHLGNPNGIRYPRPIRCAVCGDEWIHTTCDEHPFHFVLDARCMVCDWCWQASKSYQGVGLARQGVPGIQLALFELSA